MKSTYYIKLLLLATITIATACASVQTSKVDSEGTSSNPILFSLKNGMDVYSEEFEYAYQKNNFNNDKANTREDIKEYLNLYVIFKQKVQSAQDLGMDTSKTFLDEFSGYRESLANSYINSKDLTDKLIKEAYERYKEEVKASHILILTPNQEDTLAAYQKIDSVRQLAINGADFTALAKEYSEDPSAVSNGGDLGFFTSMRMVYPFETAAYNTPVGEISKITKTEFGYHLIKVTDRRSSQGKLSTSHIMIRTNPKDTEEKKEIARNKIFEIQDQLNNGVDWGLLCKQFSEDQNSRNKSGKLTPFGAGQMPPTFSQAAFQLEKPGDISDPITSPYGWHIIKLDEKLPIESYDQMKSKIKNHISRDERVAITQKALINKLKKENSFIQIEPNLNFDEIDSTLLVGQWKNPTLAEKATLFTIGNAKYSKQDFYTYVSGSQKPVRGKSLNAYRNQLYDKYVEASLMQYEKDHLADKNPEYRMLVKEYWEGILLFNLMNEKVWDKAVKDTIGLETFFKKNSDQYKWEDRVRATVYNAANKEIIDQLEALDLNDSTKSNSAELLTKFNDKSDLNLKIEERTYEKMDLDVLTKIPWELGKHVVAMDGRHYLVNIEEVIPAKSKTLKECKGLVISDYQGELEKEWVKTLQNQYPHKINEPIWNKTIKRLEK